MLSLSNASGFLPFERVTQNATYQTNPNQSQHSKSILPRLTLVVLRILRVPLMVRNVLTVLLLVSLVATSASGARINAVQTHAHASITKSTVHRAHRPARPTTSHSTASHSSRTASTTARKSEITRGSHAATRRGTRNVSSPSHHVASSSSRAATLRRARYYRNHTSAHFIPLAAVPVAPSRTQSEAMNAAPQQSADSAEPTSGTATSADPAPRPVESFAAQKAVPPETDTVPAPGTDPATIAAAGNPLAARRETRQPIGSTSSQVAELNRPPIFTGRVSSYTLRGTHDSLVRQNERSEEESLERIEDDADLQDRIARGSLVRVPESSALTVNSALPEDRRYCRPWTANFLTTLARAHQAQFHTPLVVSSAVRTVEYQKQLMRINGNAAEAEGDIVSPHVTGATIDIAKSGLSRREMLWMRNQLLGYQNAGVIDVEEEFHQRCFHITVYKNYASMSPSHRSPKDVPAPTATESDSTGTTAAADGVPNE